MYRLFGLIIVSLAVAAFGVRGTPASAATLRCGWENDQSTILGKKPVVTATNVTVSLDEGPDHAHGGSRFLKLVDGEFSPTGTPQAYVAWITGLQDGDIVDATFWVYDTTPGSPGPPSARIWAHYNDNPENINTYSGKADSNNRSYPDGAGWDELSHTWTIGDGHTGLVIEARTYSNFGDTVWIDDLEVTAPDHATIRTPELIPGDADGNGVVNAADAALLADNWLTMSDATWAMGDFNGDKKVDDADATLLAANWTTAGKTTAGKTTAGETTVPEPNGIALLIALLAALAVVWRR